MIESAVRLFLALLAIVILGLILALFAFGITSAIAAVDCDVVKAAAVGQPKMTRRQGIAKAISFGISKAQAEGYADCFDKRKPKKKQRRR